MLPKVKEATIEAFIAFFSNGKLQNDLREKFIEEQPHLNEMLTSNCHQLIEDIQNGQATVGDVGNFLYGHGVLLYALLNRQEELNDFEELMNA